MDLEKLAADWKSEPSLKYAAYDTVEELAEQLVKVHKSLMGPDAMLVGYLYQQQTRRLREALKELEHVKRQR